MLKKLIAIVFMIMGVASFAQITQLEYFIDNDPGIGNALPVSITIGDEIAASFTPNVSGLSYGLHALGIRSGTASGWGTTQMKNFFTTGLSDRIEAFEYFFDTDPGVGNATAVPVTSGENVNVTFSPDLGSLSPGLHALCIRLKSDNGKWSNTRVQNFYQYGASQQIVALEYFIDNDPGAGNATSISISTGNSISATFTPDLTGLTPGIHVIGVRVQTDNGIWGIANVHNFYKLPSSAIDENIVAVEYFVDTDPGFGAATPIVNSKSGHYDESFNVDLNGYSSGRHLFMVRAQNETGDWGVIASQEFCIGAVPDFYIDTIACVNNTVIIEDLTTNTTENTSWGWDFNGDSIIDNNSSGNQSFAFDIPGDYRISLTVSEGEGCESTKEKTIHVLTPSTPSIEIGTDNNSICSGDKVIFHTSVSQQGESPVYNWYINNELVDEKKDSLIVGTLQNGDIVRCDLQTFNHCYNNIADTLVRSNTITMHVKPVLTPAVVISVVEGTMVEGDTVRFYAGATNCGQSFHYDWRINGISTGIDSSVFSSKELEDGMLISCQIVVTDTTYCFTSTSILSNSIEVLLEHETVKAIFTASDTLGTAPLMVIFNDHSTGLPTRWKWYFGDGETSTLQSPSHTYSNTGTYSVSLVVANETSTDSIFRLNYITVESSIVNELFVANKTLSGAEIECFDAYNTITVAGSGTTVILENNSSATFIAGHSIIFLPGFHAQSGSYMNAHITSTGEYCERQPESSTYNGIVAEKSRTVVPNEETTEQRYLKVYPNPSDGRFTIQLGNFTNGAEVFIYNSIGEIIQCSKTKDNLLSVELHAEKQGIYLIKAIDGKEQFSQKIIIK